MISLVGDHRLRFYRRLLLTQGWRAVFWLVLVGLCSTSVVEAIAPSVHAYAWGLQGLIAEDNSPLNGRIPLVLLHGANPNPYKAYGWVGLLDEIDRQPAFAQKYKLYLFLYNASRSVKENGRILGNALSVYRGEHPEAPPFRFAALSLGGMIVKEALDNNEALSLQTERVIALGVPFHGSPLIPRVWFKEGVYRRTALINPFRWMLAPGYLATRLKFPNYRQDFCWDNFDNALPEALAGEGYCPMTTGQYNPKTEAGKYIVYGAFIDGAHGEQAWLQNRLGWNQRLAETQSAKHYSLFSRHRWFQMIQPFIAAVPLRGEGTACVAQNCKQADRDVIPLMVFNDGISPISSQLWLGRFVQRPDDGSPVTQEAQWQAVTALQEAHTARLFEGLDHRDWLEEKLSSPQNNHLLLDWLHPKESPKSIFGWMIEDLMQD